MRVTLLRDVFLFILICFNLASGKIFTRCGLSQELQKRNFQRSFISNWVCLIESESGKDTSKITPKADNSKSYGLFQINSKEWCSPGKKGGKCSLKCEDLVNEDLVDDAACAKKVHNEKGFQGWPGWVRSCYKRQPVDLSVC